MAKKKLEEQAEQGGQVQEVAVMELQLVVVVEAEAVKAEAAVWVAGHSTPRTDTLSRLVLVVRMAAVLVLKSRISSSLDTSISCIQTLSLQSSSWLSSLLSSTPVARAMQEVPKEQVVQAQEMVPVQVQEQSGAEARVERRVRDLDKCYPEQVLSL